MLTLSELERWLCLMLPMYMLMMNPRGNRRLMNRVLGTRPKFQLTACHLCRNCQPNTPCRRWFSPCGIGWPILLPTRVMHLCGSRELSFWFITSITQVITVSNSIRGRTSGTCWKTTCPLKIFLSQMLPTGFLQRWGAFAASWRFLLRAPAESLQGAHTDAGRHAFWFTCIQMSSSRLTSCLESGELLELFRYAELFRMFGRSLWDDQFFCPTLAAVSPSSDLSAGGKRENGKWHQTTNQYCIQSLYVHISSFLIAFRCRGSIKFGGGATCAVP